MDRSILDLIRKSESAQEILWDLCEFEVVDETETYDWFADECAEPVEVFARDGAGGFFAWRKQAPADEPRLLYVSSEGQAGAIAADLPEAIQMIIALPYWQDCLKFSGGGALEEMKKAAEVFEEDLCDEWDNIDSLRKKLFKSLRLAAPNMPLEKLHAAVTTYGKRPLAMREGFEVESLFNTFTVDVLSCG